jgi:trimeric autotransporter adhesin
MTESAIAAATLSISSAVARLDSHDSDITTLTGRIDAHDVTLGTLSATVATLSTNLSTVSGTVTAHTSDISTLQSGLSAEATTRADEDAKLQAQINDTVANTTANSSAINTLQTALSQVESGANAEVASVTAELNELGLSTIGTEEGAYVQAANATYIADATHIHEATVLLDTALAGIVGEFTTALSGKQESFAVGDGLELANGTLSVKSGVYADASALTSLSGDVTTIAGRVTTLEGAQLDLTTSGTGLTFDPTTEILSLDASILDVSTAGSLAAPVQITVGGVVAGTMSFSSGGSYTLSTSFTQDMATQTELTNTQTTLFSSLAAVSNRVTAVEDDYVTSSDLTPYATTTDLNTGLGTKQDALTFGTGLSLVGSTLSATVDLTGYATESYVDAAVSGLVDAAPGTLDTLNELASALGDDPNFATTVASSIGAKQDQLVAGDSVTLTGATISVDLSGYTTLTHLANTLSNFAPAGDYATQGDLSSTVASYTPLATHNTLASSLSTLSAIVDARQDVKAFSADLELTGAGTLGLAHDYATTSALGTLDAIVSTLSTTVSEREHIVDLSDDFTLSTAGTLSLSNAYALSTDVTTLSSTVSGINTRVTALEGAALTAASTLSASKLDHNTITLAGQSVDLGGSVSAATLSAAISSDMAVDLGISELATAATLSNYVTASSLTANYSTSSQVSELLDNKQNTLSASGPLSIESGTLSIDLSDYVTSATLASWSGSSALTTLGTISAGTWAGAEIADAYIASANTWNAKQDVISAGTYIAINGTSVAVAPELISAVEANTVKTGITEGQASEITANTAKVGFTDALARNALSASGDLSYNSTTGEMSYSSAWSVSGSVASTDAQITVSGHVLEVFDMGADMVSSPSMTLDAGSLTSLLSRQVDMGTLNQERLF